MPLFFFPFPSTGAHDDRATAIDRPPCPSHPSAAYSELYLRHVPFHASTLELDVWIDLPHVIRSCCAQARHRRGAAPRTLSCGDSTRVTALLTSLADFAAAPKVHAELAMPTGTVCFTIAKVVAAGDTGDQSTTLWSVASPEPVLTYCLPSRPLTELWLERDVCGDEHTPLVEVMCRCATRGPPGSAAPFAETASADLPWPSIASLRSRDTNAVREFVQSASASDKARSARFMNTSAPLPFCSALDLAQSYHHASSTHNACEHGANDTSSAELDLCVLWRTQHLARHAAQCVLLPIDATSAPLNASETCAREHIRNSNRSGWITEWLASRDADVYLCEESEACTTEACVRMETRTEAAPESVVSLTASSVLSEWFVESLFLPVVLTPGWQGAASREPNAEEVTSDIFSLLSIDLTLTLHTHVTTMSAMCSLSLLEPTPSITSTRTRQDNDRRHDEASPRQSCLLESQTALCRESSDGVTREDAHDEEDDAIPHRLWRVALTELAAQGTVEAIEGAQTHTEAEVVANTLLPFALVPSAFHALSTARLAAALYEDAKQDTREITTHTWAMSLLTDCTQSVPTPLLSTRLWLSWSDRALIAQPAMRSGGTVNEATSNTDPALNFLSPFAGFSVPPLLAGVVLSSPSTSARSAVPDESATRPLPCVLLPTLRNFAADVVLRRCPCLRYWHRYVLGAQQPQERQVDVAALLTTEACGTAPTCARPLLASLLVNQNRATATTTTAVTKTRRVKRARSHSASTTESRDVVPLRHVGTKRVRYLLSLCPADRVDPQERLSKFCDALMRTARDAFNPQRSLYETELRCTRTAVKRQASCMLLVETAISRFPRLVHSPVLDLSACALLVLEAAQAHDITHNGTDAAKGRMALDALVRRGIDREGTLLFSSYFYDLLDVARSLPAPTSRDTPPASTPSSSDSSLSDESERKDDDDLARWLKPEDEHLWMMASSDEEDDVPCPPTAEDRASPPTTHTAWWRPSPLRSTYLMCTGQSLRDGSAPQLSAHTSSSDDAEGWPQLAADVLWQGPFHPLFRRRHHRHVVPYHRVARHAALDTCATASRHALRAVLRSFTPHSTHAGTKRSRSGTPVAHVVVAKDAHDSQQTLSAMEEALPPMLKRALSYRRAHKQTDEGEEAATEVASELTGELWPSVTQGEQSSFARLVAEIDNVAAVRSLYARVDAQRRRPRKRAGHH